MSNNTVNNAAGGDTPFHSLAMAAVKKLRLLETDPSKLLIEPNMKTCGKTIARILGGAYHGQNVGGYEDPFEFLSVSLPPSLPSFLPSFLHHKFCMQCSRV